MVSNKDTKHNQACRSWSVRPVKDLLSFWTGRHLWKQMLWSVRPLALCRSGAEFTAPSRRFYSKRSLTSSSDSMTASKVSASAGFEFSMWYEHFNNVHLNSQRGSQTFTVFTEQYIWIFCAQACLISISCVNKHVRMWQTESKLRCISHTVTKIIYGCTGQNKQSHLACSNSQIRLSHI